MIDWLTDSFFPAICLKEITELETVEDIQWLMSKLYKFAGK